MKEYDLRVQVLTRPNLRDTNDFLLYIGRDVCDNCFDRKQIDRDTTALSLRFPERWLNILEQRALIKRIEHFYPNIQKVEIITHSVYILQTVHKEHLSIADDSSQFPEIDDVLAALSPDPWEEKGLMGNSKMTVKYD